MRWCRASTIRELSLSARTCIMHASLQRSQWSQVPPNAMEIVQVVFLARRWFGRSGSSSSTRTGLSKQGRIQRWSDTEGEERRAGIAGGRSSQANCARRQLRSCALGAQSEDVGGARFALLGLGLVAPPASIHFMARHWRLSISSVSLHLHASGIHPYFKFPSGAPNFLEHLLHQVSLK